MMNSILGDFLDKFALVYLDDILIFSRTKEDHLEACSDGVWIVKVNNTLQEVRFAMFSRRADIVQEIHKVLDTLE
ncbi:hypothetical protein O0I10_002014, partial [Lichtheimia ornata]